MDELKLRLEYLESITGVPESEDSLLKQVDSIDHALNSMLDFRQQEIGRLATVVSQKNQHRHQTFNASRGSTDNKEQDIKPTEAMKSEIIASRFESLAKLADELETHAPLQLPASAPRPDPSQLIEKASRLGREFDELNLRSAELTKKLTEQLNKENEELAKASDAKLGNKA